MRNPSCIHAPERLVLILTRRWGQQQPLKKQDAQIISTKNFEHLRETKDLPATATHLPRFLLRNSSQIDFHSPERYHEVQSV
jgi:hypothetical protein